MDQNQITRRMMQLNKTVFDINYSAMTKAYEQSGQMFETFLNQAPGLPEEGKKAVKDWMSAYRTGCNDYKKIVDDHYAKVEEYFTKEQIHPASLKQGSLIKASRTFIERQKMTVSFATPFLRRSQRKSKLPNQAVR